MSLLVALWEVVPEPSAPCLSHHEDSRDRRSKRFLPWSTGTNTRKARVVVPRKKTICCTKSPAGWEGKEGWTSGSTGPSCPWHSGTQGLRNDANLVEIPVLPLPSCASWSKLLYLPELPFFLYLRRLFGTIQYRIFGMIPNSGTSFCLQQLFENKVLYKCDFPPVAPESLETRLHFKLMFAFLLARAWHTVITRKPSIETTG